MFQPHPEDRGKVGTARHRARLECSWPTLNITYRNVTRVYFRAVSVSFDDYIARRKWNFGGVNAYDRDELLGSTPALQWDSEPPPTKDYKERTERLPAPSTLKPGFYFIVASHNNTFGGSDDQVTVALGLGQRPRR